MCDVLLPPGVNPTAVKYEYISYHIRKEEEFCIRGYFVADFGTASSSHLQALNDFYLDY
jgi:hypothetical protein